MKQEKAYLDAFDEHADALYRHCYFRVSDPERARDIVSDTFTKTWDYLVKGNTVDKFKPFLYRTLNHLIIDEYRRKKSESLDSILDESEVPEGAFDELVEGSREEVEIAIDAQHIPYLIEKMPRKHREVVVMRYIDGLMPSEIAEVLDIPVNTVSVRIHRGVTWLSQNSEVPLPWKK
jgi:RNA polymerase sigma-70 factor (ECF subfamily)